MGCEIMTNTKWAFENWVNISVLAIFRLKENGTLSHYENTPMQYTAIFHGCKNGNFQLIFFFTFFIFLLKTYIGGSR